MKPNKRQTEKLGENKSYRKKMEKPGIFRTIREDKDESLHEKEGDSQPKYLFILKWDEMYKHSNRRIET